jgi:tetratricopeptide (TPR) repeat protein
MTTIAMPDRLELPSLSGTTALRTTARLWFLVTIAGQLLFAFTVASFYGLTAARGDYGAWNRRMMHGYTAGETASNLIVAMHLFSAVIIILAGAVQLVPQIRNRFPRFHRWNGRLYLLTAFILSTAGLYMLWIRGSVADAAQRWGFTLNVVLLWLCAAMAVRYAIARDFRTHRRWALRLFLVVSASWFFRAGLFLSFLLFRGPFGFDPNTFTGPFLTFMSFAMYLFPLAVLELYFRAQDRGGAASRMAMAAALLVLTLATGAGVSAVTAAVWLPTIKAAYDRRKPIAQTLSVTVESAGIDAAVKQYRDLEAGDHATWNFDESQLNTLGYQFVRAKKFKEAIRIFQLNVEAYPQSSNTWDSLGEAYLAAGNRLQSIVNYRKALQLNPNNRNAAGALRKLGASGLGG